MPLPSKTSRLHFTSLSAIVNAFYACSHGYDFLYMQLSEEHGCAHPIFGRRHPSYCKLPAIGAALRKWRTVVFVDSDSWFLPGGPSIDSLVAASRQAEPSSVAITAEAGHSIEREPSLSLAWDLPFSNGPNCGFMIWRNSTRAQRMLDLWWHLDPGVYATVHDYEQRAMHWVIVHLEAFRGAVETLRIAPLTPEAARLGTPLLHYDHTRHAARYWRLSLAVLAIPLHMDTPPTVPGADGVQSYIHPAATSEKGAGRNHSWVSLTRGLGVAEGLLSDDSSPRRVHATSKLRRSLLRAALTAARLLLRNGRCHSAGARGAPVPKSPREGGLGGGVAAARSARGGRKLASCMSSRPFNATRAGLKWLRPPLSSPPGDANAETGTAAAAARSVAAHAATAHSVATQAVEAASAVLGRLEGAPLVLRRCSATLAPWQLWSRGGSPTSNGSILALLAGQGLPERPCATLGPGRATREPFLPLAQLGRCPTGSVDGASSKRAGRLRASADLQLIGNASSVFISSSSLGELQEADWLGGLLDTGSLWPDAPEAKRRANRRVFWPGPMSPQERAVAYGHGGSKWHMEGGGGEGGAAAADEEDGGAGEPSQEGDQNAVGQMDAAVGSEDIFGMIGSAASDDDVGNARSRGTLGEAPGRRLQRLGVTNSSPASRAPITTVAVAGTRADANAPRTDGCGVAHMPAVSKRGDQGGGAGSSDVNCCHPGGNWAGQCGPPGSGMPHTWREGWQRCNVFSASEASNATRCPESKFASWARGGNRTGAQIAAFVAKQEQWRVRNADPRRLNRPCHSEYKNRGDRGDKLREDCETWCRAKPAHCRMCKCRACRVCHNGSAALPVWASGAYSRCQRFGECAEWQAQQEGEAREREAQRELARAVLQAELKAQHAADRAAYWASHRSAGGGALCNSSADCSHHGACRLPTKTRPPNITWQGSLGGDLLNSSGSGGGIGSGSGELRADARPRCFCDEGFAGARCSYAAFGRLRSGGAVCNATLPCGGEGSSCVRSRCVCGKGWLGARCSFASFSVLAGSSGGAFCNSSDDCGGANIGSSCEARRGDRQLVAGAASVKRCRCGPGRVGARCAYAAFGDLEGGGGACNVSADCGLRSALPSTRLSVDMGVAAASSPREAHGNGSHMALGGNRRGSSGDGGGGSGKGDTNSSACVQQRCVCATGLLGAHCAYTSDQLLLSARAKARREQERVRSYHLCLSAWRGGDVGVANDHPVLEDGTPLAFAFCRRGQNRHQRWLLTFEPAATAAAAAAPASAERGMSSALRIRSQSAPDLCVTVPPLHH